MTIFSTRPASSIEPLEARYAPALVVVNPIADIVAGAGKTSATVELSQLFDATVEHPGHTLVAFHTNFDTNPGLDGIQRSEDPFVIELFDDEAPLTVQNFLRYVTNPDPAGDYTNTFFHRSAAGFVVQGGGFAVENPDEHIPVGPEVHNEFSADRSNLRGTVAMAKTGLGPHTATSEWFVNLSDNSGNLDNQNGGFTVFGRVIQGLDLFDKIDALPKTNQGGALTDLPVQNYDPDPDNNPNTPPPEPRPNQLIRIESVEVTRPVPGDATGVTFSIKSITDAASGAPGDLLTAKLGGPTDSRLRLNYAPGEAGVVNVTVTATSGADTVDETFQVKVLPNLISNIEVDPLRKIVVAGDAAPATVTLTNNGAGHLGTNVDVKFYLSKAGGADPNGTIVDPADLLVGQLNAQPVSLGNGASVDLTGLIRIPAQLPAAATTYRLIAEVTTAAGSTVTELFTDDNNAIDGNVHSLVSQVGAVSVQNFGTRLIPKLLYAEPDGDRIALRLTGSGTGSVSVDGTEVNLAVNGTNEDSVLAAKSKETGERVALHDIHIANAVGLVNFGKVDTDGHITASGGVEQLTLGDVGGDRSLIIGAALPDNAIAAALKLRRVTDLTIESDQPISSLIAKQWLDTTGDDDRLTTPTLGSLRITGAPAKGSTPAVPGDFEADVKVTGGGSISSINIAGVLRDATFTIPKANVGAVTLGGIDHAGFFVGTTGRPADLGDFTKTRTVGSFSVGVASGGGFIDSQIAAAKFGTITVAGVDGGSGTQPFGFVADSVTSYSRVTGPTGTNLTMPQTFDPLGNYSLRIL